ncbi:MAG: tetratricopeptide repeat protein [Burkholderiales bacterium]|nr:tetratricopeptide repeat protein [Burkholderiales bacterium]
MSASLNARLHKARQLLQSGDIAAALALCSEVLAKAPRNPDALMLRGIAALMNDQAADAERDFRQALAAMPGDGALLEYLGLALLSLGNFAQAEPVLQRACTLAGAPASAWMRLGLAQLHQGRAGEAVTALRQALQRAPGQPDCLLNLGQALAATGDRAAAVAQFEALLQSVPGHPDALFNLGVLELEAGDAAAARGRFEAVLARDQGHSDARVNLAVALEREGDTGAATQQLEQVLALTPAHPHAHGSLGRLRLIEGRHADARHHFDAALAALPGLSAALEGLGAVSRLQGRHSEAAHWYGLLLEQDPDDANAWSQRAESLLQIGKLEEAATAAERALALDPASAQAYTVLAQNKIVLGELGAAVDILEQGVERSNNAALLSLLTHQSRHICDWDRWRRSWAQLAPRLAGDADCGSPFTLLCEDVDAALLVDYTRRWARRRFGATVAPAPAPRRLEAGARLRIGYLSADFQEHPAAYLITEMLERHDRSRFEIFAYSYGPASSGIMRQRIVAAVDHFVDIAWDTDDAAVTRIRKDAIDILIDLKGYTVADRIEIMAQRPSPVQLTWLGYPGTTGTDFIDGIIADPQIIRPGEENTCSEQVLRMPHCYQPTDRRRVIAEPLARQDYGLPENALVFCCFNQTFKITPEVFAVWLRLLAAVPGSVLWLVDANRWASANLRTAAAAAGVDAQRLVFAPRKPLAEHLARYRVADLALDTFPYTSHTTASDALWCACPLIGLVGDTFPARVSASILTAAGLPDLVADTLAEYEQIILRLASNRSVLEGLRKRVQAARERSPLFDTETFTRDFEQLLLDHHAAITAIRA